MILRLSCSSHILANVPVFLYFELDTFVTEICTFIKNEQRLGLESVYLSDFKN